MNEIIGSVIESLEKMERAILNSSSDNKPFNEISGWSFPPLSRVDLANLSKNLYQSLKESEMVEISEENRIQLEIIPKRINSFMSTTIRYISVNPNGRQAISNYLLLIQWITNILEPLLSLQILQDDKVLPNQLVSRLSSIRLELDQLVPQKEDLLSQISLIGNASKTAESLSTDLESLKESKQKIDKFSTDSAELFGKIDNYYKSIETTLENIKEKKEETDKLVAQCEEAYRITTTKGLAGAFDQRAERLSTSMWWWVLGLLGALVCGVIIGSNRFAILNEVMSEQTSVGHIWIQIFLSVLSLGAPIWFAWIATKQISQRFKLSEDYAFKASVAKAYEGYKKEAARIDEDLELRLFSSALTRLEEAPLRLVETEHHGSPWHELVTSQQFKKALEALPELKDKLLAIVKTDRKVNKEE